ncbi:outer membrane beta-barrel protein [Spirosoma soli]|uniref:Outer membrane beta-barrel protein n=1 Tax=Spirosoma soli TaxID=1770529 RepID=A0ABW5M848_9BACT
MKTLYIFILLSFAIGNGFAQTNAITGNVREANQRPVEYATVLVLAAKDSAMVKGGLTDTTGSFTVNGLSAGTYLIRVTAMGFAQYTSQPLTLTDAQPVINAGNIPLISMAKTLTEVIVKGERPVVERSMGKMTLNVTNPFFKTATNALDVLKRAPGLIVSQDGAISIKGHYAPVVYIDGKQQPISSDELNGLQASDIEQVEVISNASAQFDGETRAVINIKLRRDKALGWKGSVYGSYVQNQRYNGGEVGGSATYKAKKWSYYGRLGYVQNTSFLTGLTRRVVSSNELQTMFMGDELLSWNSKPLSYQLSTDFTPNKNQQISLFVKGSTAHREDILINNADRIDYNTTGAELTHTQLNTKSIDNARTSNIALDLSYKGTLNQRGDQLSAFLDYAYYNTAKTQNFRNDFLDREGQAIRVPMVMLGQFPSATTIRSFRADYVHPFGKVGKLEMGVKLSWTGTNNELRYDTLQFANSTTGRGYVYDPSRSNRFLYDEKILAGYAQMSREFNKTQVEAGLRLENTNSQGNSVTLNNVVNRQYVRWLPSLKVQQKLGERDVLSASFSRKMQRPSFYDLNPFTLYLDPYAYTEGNPFLLPVTLNTTDLTYQHRTITVSLNYILNKDVFVQLPFQNDQTKVIRYTRVNLDKQQSVWLDISATQSPTKWWKMQHYASVGRKQTVSAYSPGATINTQAWNYYVNGTHNFSLPGGYNLELSYYYSGPTQDYIYTLKSNGAVSVGLQKSVLAGKGNLQLNLNDIFNTYREYFVSQYENLDVSTLQKRNSRQATLRFTYTFGKSTFNRKSQASGSAEEESRAR